MNQWKISYDRKEAVEKEKIRTMYQDVFGDPEAFTEYYFSYVYPENQVLMLSVDEKPASMIHLNPYTLFWNGKKSESCYIVAVATYEEYRRQGMMKELMLTALEDLKKRGILFTYLIPADPLYYEPFQFTYVSDWEEVILERQETGRGQEDRTGRLPEQKTCLTDSREDGTKGYRIERIRPEEYKKAADYLNKRRQEKDTVSVWADEAYMRKQAEEMRSEGGDLYWIRKEREEGIFFFTPEEEKLYCSNVWLPEKIRKQELEDLLFSAFGKQKMHLVFGGKNPDRNGKTGSEKKIMARILNLRSLFRELNREGSGTICIEIRDPWISDQRGVFRLIPENGMIRMERTKEDPEACFGIGELTEILFCYGDREKALAQKPEAVRTFFMELQGLRSVYITEQV